MDTGVSRAPAAVRTVVCALAIVGALATAAPTHAAAPWPAQRWQDATVLTGLDSDFRNNLSGAWWNPETRTLWVCVNYPGRFWALVEDGEGGFAVAERDGRRAEWSIGGDIEGITKVDPLEPAVYVVNEARGAVEKYDVSTYGAPTLLRRWDLSARLPTSGWAGAEGIAFVPDRWLSLAGFVDRAGRPFVSANGMGGVMLIAHQNGGGVHAFDLDPHSDRWDFVGTYETSRRESSGLEFDRSSGKLFVWHNTGANYLEMVDLSSFVRADGRRQLASLLELEGPRSGNLEGVALTPLASGEGWCFLTDDDNNDGGALSWYQGFFVAQVGHDRYATPSGEPLHVPAPGVCANDSGPAPAAELIAEPAHGRLVGLAPGASFDGGFVYEPDPDFVGTDVFTYKAADGDVDSAEACVLVDVLGEDDPDPDPEPDPEGRTVAVRVAASADDAEEDADGRIDLTSTDLELTEEDTVQTVAMRFAGVDIPSGAIVTTATIQFTVDETAAGATALWIEGEASPHPPAFTAADHDISARLRTEAAVSWAPPGWGTAGAAGPDQRTPDLRAVVQELVDQPGWVRGNAMVFLVTGDGRRVAESWNGDADHAPLLRVTYEDPPPGPAPVVRRRVTVRVGSGTDDATERPSGKMDVAGRGLALTKGAVGLRFAAVPIPAGATVLAASLQLAAGAEGGRYSDLVVTGERSPAAGPFSLRPRDVSRRPRTRAAVRWVPLAWKKPGEAGAAQRPPDLAAIVQEIVDGPGWASGAPLALFVTGAGERIAVSYDGDPWAAPLLTIEFEAPADPVRRSSRRGALLR